MKRRTYAGELRAFRKLLARQRRLGDALEKQMRILKQLRERVA